MNDRWQHAEQEIKPDFKVAGKLVFLAALRYNPTGIARWAVKSVARRPLEMLLASVLEPVLSRATAKLSKHYSGNQP